jgi:hypothetical protein
MKRFALSTLGLLIFLAGLILELSLSGGMLEGEIEARVNTPQVGDLGLSINCPLVLSPSETGTVSTAITNTLNEEKSPVVTADISHIGGDQHLSQTLTLAPHETQSIQWTVNSSNKIYGNLILVNVVQSHYADLPSGQGACGILVFNVLGLNGLNSFILTIVVAFLCISLGAAGWLRAHQPLNDLGRNAARASAVMVGMATAGFLSALPRWWGLTLFFDFFTLITMAVIFTEFILFPGRYRS